MIRKLTKQGNSFCLVLDRTIRDLMEINANTALKVSVEGRRLIVEPLSEEERTSRFEGALDAVDQKFGSAMRNLAK